MALISVAAAGVVEEATQVVGAAVGRTVEVGVWGFPSLFLLPLLPVFFQVKHELCFICPEFVLSVSNLITLSFLHNQDFFSLENSVNVENSFCILLFLTKLFVSLCSDTSL